MSEPIQSIGSSRSAFHRSACSRMCAHSGRGAAELFASYPLARVDGDLGFYLFAQGFTGYGEALDDHRRRDTHARIGIALTR